MKKAFKKYVYIIYILLALIGSTVNLDYNLPFRDSFNYNSINITLVLMLFYLLHEKLSKRSKNSNFIISIIIGSIISLLHVLGFGIYYYNSLDFIFYNFSCFLKFILKYCYYSFIYISFINTLYEYISTKSFKSKEKDFKLLGSNRKDYLVRTIIIILFYLPYFLNEFPGIFTIDSVNEMNYSVTSLNNLVNHHPVFHIYLIALFIKIGFVFSKSINAGIALYSVVQMLVCSFIFSYIISFLDEYKVNRMIKLIAFFFILLYPPFAAYSITMWKDIPFALGMVLFVAQMIRVFTSKDYLKSKYNILKILLLSIIVVLFRNNGIYVIVISFIIYTMFNKANRKIFAFITLFMITFYIVLKGPIFTLLNITDGPKREALSVPIQQIARTYKYKEQELSNHDKIIIHKYIKNKDIANNYYPLISDNIKNTFDEELFSRNKKDFIVLWAKLFVKYPQLYFESFFIGSMGYWYPEVDNWVIENWFDYKENNFLRYNKKPLVKIKLVDIIKKSTNERKIPIISLLFSIGFAFWILLLLLGYVLYTKNYNLIFVFVPLLVLWLTTTASPVWCEYRYIYSLFTSMPLLLPITITLCSKRKRSKNE